MLPSSVEKKNLGFRKHHPSEYIQRAKDLTLH